MPHACDVAREDDGDGSSGDAPRYLDVAMAQMPNYLHPSLSPKSQGNLPLSPREVARSLLHSLSLGRRDFYRVKSTADDGGRRGRRGRRRQEPFPQDHAARTYQSPLIMTPAPANFISTSDKDIPGKESETDNEARKCENKQESRLMVSSMKKDRHQAPSEGEVMWRHISY